MSKRFRKKIRRQWRNFQWRFNQVRIKFHWLWLLSLPVWLMPGLYLSRGDLLDAAKGAIIYATAITLCGVLPHELGHAIVSCCMGVSRGTVHLAGLGGGWMPDVFDWEKLAVWQRNLVIISGPAVNFLLYGLCVLTLILLEDFLPVLALRFLKITEIVNLIMGAINLIPVFPMDGGRLFGSLLQTIRLKVRWVRSILMTTTIILCGSRFAFLVLERDWLSLIETSIIMFVSITVISVYDFEAERALSSMPSQKKAFRDWNVRNY